jgi:acetyl esterase/lipase
VKDTSASSTTVAATATPATPLLPYHYHRNVHELLALDDVLICVERLLHTHLLDLLDREMEFLSSVLQEQSDNHGTKNNKQGVLLLHDFFGEHIQYPTISDTINTLSHAERMSRDYRVAVANNNTTTSTTTITASAATTSTTMSSRSMKDSSLFRLIVTLQLCLVRLDEANSVLCNGLATCYTTSPTAPAAATAANNSNSAKLSSSSNEPWQWMTNYNIVAGGSVGLLSLGGATATVILSMKTKQRNTFKLARNITFGMTTAYYIRKRWRTFCINARIADTATVTEDWIFNWICLVNNNNNGRSSSSISMTDDAARQQQQQQLRTISRSSRTKNLWYSNGRIRFQLIKRGMDIWYATVGKAVELTNGGHEISDPSWNQKTIWTYVVASLAASYYNCVGPTAASALALANSPSSVIQEAWGVVSMPAVKRASLEATRILKGAAIADRVDICGVSCFVLSQEPIPALSLALRRYQRRQEREGGRLLDTILERTSSRQSSLVRDNNNIKGFQKHNVILHLTGGGFFAHTIAGDLPYLLDWSASSKAVIIVPEYSLVPRKYPDAITEIVQIYSALRYGQATAILGFQPDRIIVSGESVGGNLATALCVSLIMNHNEMGHCVQELTHEESFEMVSDLEDSENEEQVRKHSSSSSSSYIGLDTPDALLLCCPALNLSLESSPSRIHGAHDPVLPSALFSTISTSYLGGCLPTDPVASPYFASDATICSFPPTLIFTSSDDPLLDDSVSFNGRLRSVGVSSRLRAVHDMPHAFWALSTAGIPEARQVQKECQRFLSKMFDSSDETEVFD